MITTTIATSVDSGATPDSDTSLFFSFCLFPFLVWSRLPPAVDERVDAYLDAPPGVVRAWGRDLPARKDHASTHSFQRTNSLAFNELQRN